MENSETYMEKVKRKLFDEMKVSNFKFTPGSNRDATAEDYAKAIYETLVALENGECEDVTDVAE